MYLPLIALAWLFVAVLMAAAEATAPQGSVLGALVTLVLYGLVPVAILVYILSTPMRRRLRSLRNPAAAPPEPPADARQPPD